LGIIESERGASDLHGISQRDTALDGNARVSQLAGYTNPFELPRSRFEPKAALLIVAIAIRRAAAHRRRINPFANDDILKRKLCPAVQVGNP
jgi:hypothetical protein